MENRFFVLINESNSTEQERDEWRKRREQRILIVK